MEHYQTWRDLLATAIEKPRARARLARMLGVSVPALQGWTNGEGTPRPDQLQSLLQALPQHQRLLRVLLAEEFEDIHQETGAPDEDVATTFSAHIFEIHANAPEEARHWSICTAVLAEAVKQLDPHQTGIALSISQCMISSPHGNVRYLRECAALGTAPWSEQIELRASFLGAESLAGHALSSGLPCSIDDSQREKMLNAALPEHAVSALAVPIQHTGQVAGCLLAMSTRPDFFAQAGRLEMLQNYAALLALAFSPEQFYPLAQVALQTMPTLQIQRPYLSTFQQRVLATLKTAFTGNHSLSYPEVQHYVWGQIAEELAQLQTP